MLVVLLCLQQSIDNIDLCNGLVLVVLLCLLQQNIDNIDLGMDYMVQGAEAGDRSAMIFVARAFETGENLGSRRLVELQVTFGECFV